MAKKKLTIADRLAAFYGLNQGETITQRMISAGINGNSIAGGLFDIITRLYHPYEDRWVKYRDYDSADAYSDIHVALNTYASEVSQKSLDNGRKVWVESPDKDLVKLLHELFDTLDLDTKIWGMSRHLAKYGDMFTYLIVNEDEGVTDVQFFHPSALEVQIDPESRKLIGWKITTTGRSGLFDPALAISSEPPKDATNRSVFDIWEFMHFKVPGSDLASYYGQSLIEGARQTWKQLEMLEIAVSIYRLHRAGTRLAYFIDVGTAAADEARQIVEAYRSSMQKSTYLRLDGQGDPQQMGFAEYLSKYNPMGLLADVYWPVSEGSKSDIRPLNSDVDVRAIADIEHFKSKLRVALGIPKAYLDGDISGWSANKALGQQDIQFWRRMQILQDAIASGLDMLCRVHLIMCGYATEGDELEFTIKMQTGSVLAEMQKIEAMSQRLTFANSFVNMIKTFGFDVKEGAPFVEWVMETILGFDKTLIRKFRTKDSVPVTSEEGAADGLEALIPKKDDKGSGTEAPDITEIRLSGWNRQILEAAKETKQTLEVAVRGLTEEEARSQAIEETLAARRRVLTERVQQIEEAKALEG